MALRVIQTIDDTPFGQLLTAEGKQRANDRLAALRLRYQDTQPDIFINSLFDRAVNYSRYSDIQRIRIWDRNLKYYKGNHVGHWDNSSPWWVIDDPTTAEGVYRINLYNFFIRSVEALWSKSNTKIEFKARDNSAESQGAASVADKLWKSWSDRRWGASMRHLESKHAQITGNYLRRHYYSSDSGMRAWRPKTEEVQISGEDEGYLCGECGMAGPLSANNDQGTLQSTGVMIGAPMPPANPDGSCPSCGSRNVDQFGLPPMTMTIVTGQEQFDPGDPMIEIVDPTEGTLHLHSQALDASPWFLRHRLFASEILEAHFPWAEVPRAQSTDLRLILQRRANLDPGSNYSPLTDGSLQSMGELEEGWFEPVEYANYITPQAISGEIQLPPKTAMIELFPDGFYAQRIGGRIVDGPWPAEKNYEWAHGRFDVVMQSIWGRGQDDSLTANERLEEEGSLAFEIAMHQASSPLAINPFFFSPEDVDGHPRSVMVMKNPDPEADPQKGIWQGQAQTGGIGALDRLMDRDERNMQKMHSAFASLMGDSEGRGDPATRTAILRDQAIEMHASPLELKEEVDAGSARRVVRLYQEHWDGNRLVFTKGDYDDEEGKFFSRADVQGDFEAVAVRGSSTPRGDAERRAAVVEAAGFGNIPGGLFNEQAWKPKLRRFALTEMGLQYDVDDAGPDYRKQQMEIRRVLEIAETAIESFEEQGVSALVPGPDGEPIANEMLAMFLARKIPVEIASPPGAQGIGISIDNDQVHMACVNEWLLKDEGMQAHPVIRRAMMLHLQEHVQAALMTAQYKSMLSVAASGPERAAAQEDAAANADTQARAKGLQPAGDKGPDSGKQTAERSRANQPSSDQLQRQTSKEAQPA
jgi:hypothetical protein